MSEYPEHEKLKKVQAESQIVGEFLEWLENREIALCQPYWAGHEFEPIAGDSDDLPAEYFGIDLSRLEKEKQAMLKAQREMNEKREVE